MHAAHPCLVVSGADLIGFRGRDLLRLRGNGRRVRPDTVRSGRGYLGSIGVIVPSLFSIAAAASRHRSSQ